MSTGSSAERPPATVHPSVALSPVAPPPEGPVAPLDVPGVAALGERLRARIREGMQIDDDVLEVVLSVLLAGGHLLLEDRPGVGKTQLARTIAASIGGRFARVQATVDLLPSDVLGASVWHAGAERFEFHPGPIFANVVLVDELNRTTPKTQSGLLEAMQELQVTVDGRTHHLERPFLVVATQNPAAGFDGTYPLPPAQLDRFLARVSLGYPSAEQEAALLRERPQPPALAAGSLPELVAAHGGVTTVRTAEPLLAYVVALLRATREHPLAESGASPRAGLQLVGAAKARAALDGRDHVLPDDVQALAPAVLAHRIEPVPAAPLEAQAEVVADALRETPAR
ncbi:MoxR family ATPase [Patulibacter sp. SYSU D01012]|uniref:AAA family ATPase n=1 Tax=Patulibacter sp. SYSU D01012 TaxID=2817381 RepID=UPI001FEEC06B|nr:MoxR family ATPase [Patulibacter sp. SYSU D01012]